MSSLSLAYVVMVTDIGRGLGATNDAPWVIRVYTLMQDICSPAITKHTRGIQGRGTVFGKRSPTPGASKNMFRNVPPQKRHG